MSTVGGDFELSEGDLDDLRPKLEEALVAHGAGRFFVIDSLNVRGLHVVIEDLSSVEEFQAITKHAFEAAGYPLACLGCPVCSPDRGPQNNA